jgi:hypothetical protein
VDEGRKRTLAVVTAVLLVPRLGNLAWDGHSNVPSNESFLMSALSLAERIMEVIDQKYAGNNSYSTNQRTPQQHLEERQGAKASNTREGN